MLHNIVFACNRRAYWSSLWKRTIAKNLDIKICPYREVTNCTQLAKCNYFEEKVAYLDHIVGKGGKP